MNNLSEFNVTMEELRNKFESIQSLRDSLIKESRDLIVLSKKAIYSCHRFEIEKASDLSKKLEIKSKEFVSKFNSNSLSIDSFGFANMALQEFIEAKGLVVFLKEEKLLLKPDFVPSSAYLTGLCDLAGEIVRIAVNNALKDKILFENCKTAVTQIHDELMIFDLPNSELRRKFDSLKYAVKKLEEINLEMGFKNE